MAWSESKEVRVNIPLEKLELMETNWGISPATERERWERDFKRSGCDLIGEFEIDEDITLLRFRVCGSPEDLYGWQAKRHHNVLLSKKMPPYKPVDLTYLKNR